MKLTHARLVELLDYNRDTGVFTWRVGRGGKAYAGSPAGCLNGDGYIQINVDRTLYRAHRLAWLYVFGTWPSYLIDHVNRNRADNRIANLRAADKSENACNAKIRVNSSSGVLGVNWDKQCSKWRVKVWNDGRCKNIGVFRSFNDAVVARQNAAMIAYGEFAPEIQNV